MGQRRWRGGDDPSGYRRRVADDLQRMRFEVDMTMEQMAGALTRELRRPVRGPQIWAWECGETMPGSDVLYAYITVAGAARPFDSYADERMDSQRRIRDLESRLDALTDATTRAELPEPDDLMPPVVVAKSLGLSKQTIHNYIGDAKVRFRRSGGRMLVSASDARAERDRRAFNLEARRRPQS